MARRSKSKRTRKSRGHRQAPRPIHWSCKRGNCRFCGDPIVENGVQNNRKHWHQACADLWRLMNNPQDMRHHVFIREVGTCQGCGVRSPLKKDFQADHIEPLFESDGDPQYYHPDNVQLLCIECHKGKTNADMIRYRSLKRQP